MRTEAGCGMHDLILAGAGLANGLIAWRLKQIRPELRVLLMEEGDLIGGNHTWSFYEHDLTPEQRSWMQPLIVRQWAGYDVRFPTHRRSLDTVCCSVTSERFHEVLSAALGNAVMPYMTVTNITSTAVQASGQEWKAKAVIDGRGAVSSGKMQVAFQKFVGQELVFSQPHGQSRPIIMDATVRQHDGYRFVYTLPFDARRMLVEDTYYSTSPALDMQAIRGRIGDYVAGRSWVAEHVVREETGVLPIALGGDIAGFWEEKPESVACSGLRAGLFHATTGYSLLYAVRLADEIANLPSLDTGSVYRCIRAFSEDQWRRQAFMRLLNRMLFFASPPDQRYRLLQRFYRLPQPLIERFYAARPTWSDKLRILSGKPPVPVLAAMKAAFQ